jgi:hypothetical protein
MTNRLVLGWPAPPDRHLQGVDDQLGTDVIGDGPADDASAPRVEHHRHVHLALVGEVLGDVGDPEAVGSRHTELAVDQVIGGNAVGITPCAPVLPALVDAGDARRPHQALDAFAADAHALAQAQLVVDARRPIAASGHLMDGEDLLGQLRVAPPALTRVGPALAPLIEPRRRDA